MFTTYNNLTNVRNEYKKTMINIEWISIEKILEANKGMAQIKADNVKESIINQIPAYYSANELDQLKTDLNSLEDTKISKLFKNVIADSYMNINNDNNRLVIASNYGVIADARFSASDKEKDWESLLNDSPNPIVKRDFIDTITNKTVNPSMNVFYQVYPSDGEDIKRMDLNEIKQEYVREGITCLKKYKMVAIAYIYNDRDYFETPIMDTHGRRITSSNRIIISQEFHMYDAVSQYSPMFLDYVSDYKNSTSMDIIVTMTSFASIGIILALSFISIMILVIMCVKKGNEANDRDDNR